MNRQLKQGGLSLNPKVRDHRQHDSCPITNIKRGVDIRRGGMPTRHTPEQRLALAVPRIAVPTNVACATGVAWIDHDHGHTCQRRFKLHEPPKLPKRPVMVSCSVWMPNRSALADTLEVFNGYASRAAFGFRNKLLADDMVGVGLEAALSAAELFQAAFGALCANALKRGASFRVALTRLFNLCSTIDIAVASGGKVDDTKIDAQRVVNLRWWWRIDVARYQQVEASLAIHQITLTLARLQQVLLTRATLKRDVVEASLDGPERYRLLGELEGKDAVIKGDSAMLGVGALALVIQLVAITHLCEATDRKLCTQAVLGADPCIDQRLQGKRAKGLLFPGHTADLVTCSIGLFKCLLQGSDSFRGRNELQF